MPAAAGKSSMITRYQKAKSVVAVAIVGEIDLYEKPKSLQERMRAVLIEVNKGRLTQTEIKNAKIHTDDTEND